MGKKLCYIVYFAWLLIGLVGALTEFNCSSDIDRWMCTDGCFEKSDVRAERCIAPSVVTCYGVPITHDVALSQAPLANFSDPLIKLFPSCYRKLLPLICTTSYTPCKNMKVLTESGESDVTFKYKIPRQKCTAMARACEPLFNIRPSLKKLLPFDCDDKNGTFSDACQATPSFLPVFESNFCPWPLVRQETTPNGRYSNKLFDECHSPCRLISPELQWYEHFKFSFTSISLLLMLVFLVSTFCKTDVLKRSISARFFMMGVFSAIFYTAIWMISSSDLAFNSVTCSYDNSRLLPNTSPPHLGACSWLQKLITSCLLTCTSTPMLAILLSIAGKLQTKFTILWIRKIEKIENFVWVALLVYCSTLPQFLVHAFGVERDEFSGVCMAGNLSTLSMGTNVGLSIFFVLLVSCQAALSAFASKHSSERVTFVELVDADKMHNQEGDLLHKESSSKSKARRASRSFLHKNHLYSGLSLGVIILCYAAWFVAIGVHPLVVPGWPSREKQTALANLKCLANLDPNSNDAFHLDHGYVGAHHECNKTALSFRPIFSFVVFVVLPVLPFLFVAIIDALPSIWNSSFGMGMWARRKLLVPTTLTESNSQPASKDQDVIEASRNCSSDSSLQATRRAPRTSRLYQPQRGVNGSSTTPPIISVDEVQRLVQTFSTEIQSLTSERAELREVTRIQDQTLITLSQQLDNANVQLAAYRGEAPPPSVIGGQLQMAPSVMRSEQEARMPVSDEQVLARFPGFGRAQPVEAMMQQQHFAQERFSPQMQPSTSRDFTSFQGFRPPGLFGQSSSVHHQQAEKSESDESVPSYEDVQDLNELRRRANGRLEEPREDDQGPLRQQHFQLNRQALPSPSFSQPINPVVRLDPYGMPYPMSSVMTVPEIQLRAQVLRQVLHTNTNIPVYPFQIAIILERAGVLNRVDAQRPLRPNHVIYTPDRIEAMLGTTTSVPPNLRDPNVFRDHIGLLAFQQGLTLAVIYRDAAGPPRSLPQILERINIAEIVPSQLRELSRQGDLNAINQARQIIERSPHAIRLNLENRVHQAFLYVRDFLDSRATMAGLPPANLNPVENNEVQQPHDSDSAVETS